MYCTEADRYYSLGFRRKVCFGDKNQDRHLDRMQVAGTAVGYNVDVPYEPLGRGENELVRGGDRRELVYQGVAGGILRILYREYANDFARPAFFQESSYDYQPGMTVGFKGVRLEVLGADGERVTFKVLRGFTE
jgi:hypothetical protein